MFGNKAFSLLGIQRATWELAAHQLQHGPLGAGTIMSPIFEEGARIQKEVAREKRDSPKEGKWGQGF